MITLCLDYGERYVGVAITDREGKMALRHSVIDQNKDDVLQKVAHLVEHEDIEVVLIGVPIGLSGQETEQTHVSLEFLEKLRGSLGDEVQVQSVDETLTSVEAARHIRAEGGKPEDEHAEAARLMLSDYLRSL